MHMMRHHYVGGDINGKQAAEQMDASLNKESAVGIIFTSGMIDAAKKRAAHTARSHVVEGGVVDTDEGFSGKGRRKSFYEWVK
jgi:hypothetical protein